MTAPENISIKILSFFKTRKLEVALIIFLTFFLNFYFYILSPALNDAVVAVYYLIYFPTLLLLPSPFMKEIVFINAFIFSFFLVKLFQILLYKKWLFVPFVLILFFILELDAPLINNTINKPNYSCVVDSDCAAKNLNKQYAECSNSRSCVNKDWDPISPSMDKIILSVFALCVPKPIPTCSCIQNTCQ